MLHINLHYCTDFRQGNLFFLSCINIFLCYLLLAGLTVYIGARTFLGDHFVIDLLARISNMKHI